MNLTLQLQFVIPTLFGLEGVCANELRHLGLQNVKAENGRVLCLGGVQDIARLNLNVRTGERILIELGRFHAASFDELFEGVHSLPLENWIPKDAKFPVKGFCLNSQLHAVSPCQAIVKKAAAIRLGQSYGLTVLPETGPLFQIQFSILSDETVLMLDTSGPGLYKRGYRAVGGTAPLRETLAAALVLLSRYHGKDPFRDPFCGSGTIPIEAALIAHNRAPGLNRSFSAQKWTRLEPHIWMDAVDEAIAHEFHGHYDILGSDLDPSAVKLAQANALKAGVDHDVRFTTADALAFLPKESRGRIVTNPPYGERLLEKREAENLYKHFGRVYANLPVGWQLYLLSAHTEFERTFGHPAEKKRKLYNGMLKCDLFMYHVKGK